MNPEEALEFIDNEIQGGFIVGEQAPIVMWSQFMVVLPLLVET